jgi:hypothetical protein
MGARWSHHDGRGSDGRGSVAATAVDALGAGREAHGNRSAVLARGNGRAVTRGGDEVIEWSAGSPSQASGPGRSTAIASTSTRMPRSCEPTVVRVG